MAVAFSQDNKWIASGSTDRTIKIWNAITGKEVRTLVGHADRVHEVAFSLDSLQLVSLSADDIAKVWDIKTGEELNQLIPTKLANGSEAHSKFWTTFGGEIQTRLRFVDKKAICSAYNSDRSRGVEAETSGNSGDKGIPHQART